MIQYIDSEYAVGRVQPFVMFPKFPKQIVEYFAPNLTAIRANKPKIKNSANYIFTIIGGGFSENENILHWMLTTCTMGDFEEWPRYDFKNLPFARYTNLLHAATLLGCEYLVNEMQVRMHQLLRRRIHSDDIEATLRMVDINSEVANFLVFHVGKFFLSREYQYTAPYAAVCERNSLFNQQVQDYIGPALAFRRKLDIDRQLAASNNTYTDLAHVGQGALLDAYNRSLQEGYSYAMPTSQYYNDYVDGEDASAGGNDGGYDSFNNFQQSHSSPVNRFHYTSRRSEHAEIQYPQPSTNRDMFDSSEEGGLYQSFEQSSSSPKKKSRNSYRTNKTNQTSPSEGRKASSTSFSRDFHALDLAGSPQKSKQNQTRYHLNAAKDTIQFYARDRSNMSRNFSAQLKDENANAFTKESTIASSTSPREDTATQTTASVAAGTARTAATTPTVAKEDQEASASKKDDIKVDPGKKVPVPGVDPNEQMKSSIGYIKNKVAKRREKKRLACRN